MDILLPIEFALEQPLETTLSINEAQKAVLTALLLHLGSVAATPDAQLKLRRLNACPYGSAFIVLKCAATLGVVACIRNASPETNYATDDAS